MSDDRIAVLRDELETTRRRAEAAEQSRAKFMEQLRVMGDLAETAQARAEAAEEQLKYLGGLHRAEWESQVARAEAAEKRLSALEEALPYVGLQVTYLTVDDGDNIAVSLDALEAKP